MTTTAVNPNDWSSFAEDIGTVANCAACGSQKDVLIAWVSGIDQLMCRECADAWVRLVWPDVYLLGVA